ncbi:Ig-like domain-containing protein [Erwinia sp. P7711]|uniref:Ig-like domain-containing protein n=1 Tax=Erwinia sp. P7711 TaxID=3141451 RepID=UPI00318E52C1
MSQRDDYRSLRLDSIFQTAVSDYAVLEAPLSAETNRVVIPVSAQESESTLSAPADNTLAVSAVAAEAPEALRPYEPVATDGVIAAWEAAKPIHLRGQAVGEAGSTVTLTFNDQSWVSTVNKWGYWNASMPPEVLKDLPDGYYSLKLTITDSAGNSKDTQVEFGVFVDKTIKPTVTIDTVSGDNAVNYAESIYGVDISGTSTHMASGSKITLKLGAFSVIATAASNGTWNGHFTSEQLLSLQDGVHSLSVTAVDPNGNTSTVTHDLTLITHMSSVPDIRFDKVTDDNVINLVESQHDLLFSGSLSTVTVGQELILQGADGKEHVATIDAQGHWQLLVTAADMPGFTKNGEIHAWYHDGAKNYTDMTHELNIVTGFIPVYYEMSVGGDMTLNYQEAQQGLSFYIEGVNELEINGKTYLPDHGEVTLPSEDLLALAEGPVTALAHRWDEYGNSDTQTLTNFFNVATHNLPTLTLNTPFDDHVVDANDVNTWHLLQGTSTHLDQGSTVTLTLGDQSYSAAIKADGHWALTIPAGALAPLDDGDYELKVTAHDSAGNSASASDTVTVASHLNALNMDALLDFYAPSAAQDETSAGAVSLAQGDVVATDSHVAPAPIDSNLVSEAPYTLADHLMQHNPVLV